LISLKYRPCRRPVTAPQIVAKHGDLPVEEAKDLYFDRSLRRTPPRFGSIEHHRSTWQRMRPVIQIGRPPATQPTTDAVLPYGDLSAKLAPKDQLNAASLTSIYHVLPGQTR
jgi:hypothetical protein